MEVIDVGVFCRMCPGVSCRKVFAMFQEEEGEDKEEEQELKRKSD